MEKAKVYFDDFRAPVGTSVLKKLDRLICDYLDSISIEDLRQGKKLPADPSASQDPA